MGRLFIVTIGDHAVRGVPMYGRRTYPSVRDLDRFPELIGVFGEARAAEEVAREDRDLERDNHTARAAMRPAPANVIRAHVRRCYARKPSAQRKCRDLGLDDSGTIRAMQDRMCAHFGGA